MLQAEVDIEVPFHDVDPLNIVWHGHYVKYFELARCKLLEDIGYTYKDMADSGFIFPVVDMRIKYVKPAEFTQKLTVSAVLREWQYRLKIEYLVVDADTKETLTKGFTIQAAVDITTQLMRLECPDVFIHKVEQYKKIIETPKS